MKKAIFDNNEVEMNGIGNDNYSFVWRANGERQEEVYYASENPISEFKADYGDALKGVTIVIGWGL